MKIVASSGREVDVLLGLGANQGNAVGQLRHALRSIAAVAEVRAVSSVYLTEPVGLTEQPVFHNLVCRCATLLPVSELHRHLLRIEAEIGRVRTGVRDAPRRIDIDILAYADLCLDDAELTVPHPRLHQRAFVLVPLEEVAPDWVHPVLRRTPREMLSELRDSAWVRRLGDLDEIEEDTAQPGQGSG